jgi:nicotinamide mononucleotide transporter
MKKTIYALSSVASVALVAGSWFKWFPISETEALAFITGGVCVWLTVKENIWNWPIGIANSAFFTVLFLHAGLYADTGLQVVYIILGFLGWYWWLYGGKDRSELPIARTNWRTGMVLAFFAVVSVWGMTVYLRTINDTAPFLDALTTVVSLAAQYLLTKKLLENWHLWIAVDVLYVGLYAYKDLYLTSVLYFIFLCMAIAGLKEWKRTLALQSKTAATGAEVLEPAVSYAETV